MEPNDALTDIAHNYIVCNVSAPTTESRAERVDFVAEHLLSRSALLVRLLVRQVHAPEISRTEVEVLSILTEGPRRVTELAELEGLAQPTMTLLVKRLEDKGWVYREGLPGDGRVVMIAITDAGGDARQTFRERFLAALRADLRDLTDQQLDDLATAAKTVSSFVDELQQRAGR
jgi:DNA-binding MarR family transcriptional regulator